MPKTPLGIPVKNPLKPRIIRIVCRHARRKPGSQTHEFPNRVMLRYSGLGRWRDLYAEFPTGYGPSRDGPWELSDKYQYKCPRCRCDLQLREASMLKLIDALDAIEHLRSGNPGARVHRLDISVADPVLRSSGQAGQSA